MILLLLLSLAGLADSAYLTWEHFRKVIPPCSVNPLIPAFLVDCGKVLTSPYSSMFGIPLAVLGLVHYGVLAGLIVGAIFSKNKLIRYLIVLQTIAGAMASAYFMYIQIGIIGSICLYCTLSAIVSFTLAGLVYSRLKKERFEIHTSVYAIIYQKIIKPIFFLLDPEIIHGIMVASGKLISGTPLMKLVGSKFVYKDPILSQKISGIRFENPIGLAAGFDYNADLTQALHHLDFGFQTVGTITNGAYEGNPRPRLGRLIRSQSLMVNKGFKNKGAFPIAYSLKSLKFKIPVGVSIGMTHSSKITSIDEAIRDILSAFKKFENVGVQNSHYELNISCPNLVHAKNVSFYPPRNLEALLKAVDRLRLKKPVFIKMPIEKTNREVGAMLATIISHKSIKGVIFGNLQKDRKNPRLIPSEVKKFKVGYFSGKPCEERSNELIKFAFKKYGDRLTIIGCGGVFNGSDAYKKIKLGASLIQLITGMIFQGPQVISQINLELIELLKNDGFKNIKEAVGYENS